MDEGLVKRADHARDWVFGLGVNLAAEEEVAERRRHSHREEGRREHDEGLCIRQGLEEATSLSREAEDWQERDGDDAEREEDRRRDLAGRLAEQLRALLFGHVRGGGLELLVGGLDHDDLGVHSRAYRDGDAAEGHDRRGDAREVHGDEGRHDSEREGEDGEERAPDVQEEEDDHGGDDDHLLDEGVAERRDRPLDQARAVVDRHDLDPGREGRTELLDLLLHAADDVQRVLAIAHHDDAGHGLSVAVQIGGAAADLGAHAHAGDVLHEDRSAAFARADDDAVDVLAVLEIAAAPDEILALRHLDHAAAHVAVRAPHGRGHVGDRQSEATESDRVDGDLVLLLEAAHRGDLGDARDARERVPERVVLERPELPGVVFA